MCLIDSISFFQGRLDCVFYSFNEPIKELIHFSQQLIGNQDHGYNVLPESALTDFIFKFSCVVIYVIDNFIINNIKVTLLSLEGNMATDDNNGLMTFIKPLHHLFVLFLTIERLIRHLFVCIFR